MQMAFKLDGKHDIRGLQLTSMDTVPPPPRHWLRYAGLLDQSWAWHREPLMSGAAGHHTMQWSAGVRSNWGASRRVTEAQDRKHDWQCDKEEETTFIERQLGDACNRQ